MKVGILADSHFGCRSGSKLFLDKACEYYRTQFFPELEKRNIGTIIHLGDIWDNRKHINFQVLNTARKNFLEPLAKYDVHMLCGNHDEYHSNSADINSLVELCGSYGFKIYSETTEIELDSTKILMVPWINMDNHETSMNSIIASKAQVCMGHLQIQGFEMYLGSICHDGLQASLFDKFDCTFSGHFHRKSSIGNIHYLGTPYQWTWNDYGEIKGFHIFDTEIRKLEFIPNKNQMFHKIVYNDKINTYDIQSDLEMYRDTYVKIIIENKDNPYAFDMFKSGFDDIA